MSIMARDGVIHFEGRCGIEEAEALLGHLSAPGVRVDLGACEHLHTALLQALMASRVPVQGKPCGFVADWVLPLLSKAGAPSDTG